VQGCEVWLPEDVYPVYWELARGAGLACRPFATYPALDLGALAAAPPRSAVVLPCPLSPVGRPLTAGEAETLRAWLAAEPERRGVLDTVYCFANRLDAAAVALWRTGRVFVVHSLAKAWLSPETLGIVLAPAEAVGELTALLPPPKPDALPLAHLCLTERRDLPESLQRTFERRWRRLAPTLRAVVPGWRPPATGYFATLAVPFAELLERHDWLAVPASVFGSSDAGQSVITCLYYPDEGGRDGAAP
jgi:hypothetical protein